MRIGYEARKGKTGILLLHGLSGTPGEVEPLGKYLADRDISVLAPWLKGHGTSPKDLAATVWGDWADSATEAYDELRTRCSSVYIGGLSMGALLALHIASHTTPAGVLSMAAPVHISDFRFRGIAFFRFLQWRTSDLTGGILDPQAPPHVTYPYVATKSLYELKKLMAVVSAELPGVVWPALVVQGMKDSMVPLENGKRVYDGLGSRLKHLVVLDRSDHVVTMDLDKEEVFIKVYAFIRSEGRETV